MIAELEQLQINHFVQLSLLINLTLTGVFLETALDSTDVFKEYLQVSHIGLIVLLEQVANVQLELLVQTILDPLADLKLYSTEYYTWLPILWRKQISSK